MQIKTLLLFLPTKIDVKYKKVFGPECSAYNKYISSGKRLFFVQKNDLKEWIDTIAQSCLNINLYVFSFIVSFVLFPKFSHNFCLFMF